MPSKPFIRGVELRQKLKQAKGNEIISLPLKEKDFGEYEGPFILDKPITLKGLGDGTPLFAKGSPAIIILSKGVTLENLQLANTFDLKSGVCLLVEEKAEPILKNVNYCGQEIIMSREHIIDLGDFLPQQQASSFFEVEVAAPTRIKCAENSAKWLRISTDTLPSAGKYLLQIMCDAKVLGLDAIAAGGIELQTGSEIKTIWVTVHVLPTVPPKLLNSQIALLLGKDQRYRFLDGFIIGKSCFPGLAAASSMAERQAFLLKEGTSGAWAIFQPWQTPTPTIVNGQPMSHGQRLLLQEGSIIRAGSLDLKVEVFTGPGSFSVNKPLLDLGSPGSTPPDAGFRLVGNVKDKIRFLTTVPWIKVSPTEVEVKKDETKDIAVSLVPSAINLPPIKHRERGAILIQGKNETLSCDVSLEVKAQTIIPRVAPETVNMGVITDWKKAQSTIVVFNDGTKEWCPTVKANKDWLAVEPSSLTIHPGKSTNLVLRLNSKVENLVSPSDQSAAISLAGDGVSLNINVSTRLQLQQADPILETPILDFKEIDDCDRANPSTIIIKNKGTKTWQAVVQTTVKWLEIPGDKNINIPASGSKSILVQINHSLPIGEHNISDAILIEGEGKKLVVQAKVKLHAPTSIIDIFPRSVDFGKFDNWKTAPIQKVTFRNRGNAEWSGSVRCAIPWLVVEPAGENWKCAAKSESIISFQINEKIVQGLSNVPDAVIFEGPGGPFLIQVKTQFEPLPRVRSIPIDFGEVAGWESSPQMALPVYNDGNKDWCKVNVNCALPWITVSPKQIIVPQKGKTELQIHLNESLNDLASGQYEKQDAILLDGEGICLPIAVKLILPQIDLKANNPEIALEIASEADILNIRQKIVITNVGRRDWTGRIESRVPWLKIEPEQATIGVGGTLNIAISVTKEILDLGTGEQLFKNLIAFEHTSLAVDVRVQIKKATIVSDELECGPSPLDLGKIQEGEKTISNCRELTIYCERDWQATVSAQENWFQADQSNIIGSAGKHTRLKIKLTQEAGLLAEGVHWSELRITSQSGRVYTIPVKIEKIEVTPDLLISPPTLDIAWHVSESGVPTRKFRIDNRNNKDWKISMEVADNWVSILPPISGICPALGFIEFEATLTDGANVLKEGKYTSELAVRIGGKYRIPYQVVLVVDRSVYDWDIYPEGITFGQVTKNSSWDQRSPEELIVRNKGNRDISLTASVTKGEQWLEVVPSTLKVSSHSERKLTVYLKDGIWKFLRLGPHQGNIQISGAGAPTTLIAALQLVADSGRIPIQKESIDKKPLLQKLEISPGEIQFAEPDASKWRTVPGQKIKIYNPNGVEWVSDHIACEEWLSVDPKDLELSAYGEQYLDIKLKPSPFSKPGELREEDKDDAIIIRRGDEVYKIRVLVGKNLSALNQSIQNPSISSASEQQDNMVPKGDETLPRKHRSNLFGHKMAMSEDPERAQPASFSDLENNVPDVEKEGDAQEFLQNNQDDSLEVTPLQLDFGQVKDWSLATHQVVIIRNRGDQPINIKIQAATWIKVSIADTSCPSNGQISLDVSLLKPRSAFYRQSKGRQWDPRGLVITSEKKSFPISVSVETIE